MAYLCGAVLQSGVHLFFGVNVLLATAANTVCHVAVEQSGCRQGTVTSSVRSCQGRWLYVKAWALMPEY